ncbi:Putative PAN/Apple domain-containing protein [Septoria linicola]|uniref:PAN/Apple domain-containing protein n=1 Tax=Septoria linicola TaxID=215465 RepID=A0A9Q9AKP0_9PEZI|nr:putative PAN/Apple domain-containing protein [Septoria linicola]USW50795.1 Putative PAN/Apple domain-containing protein [Septoria linicola]
MGNVCSFDSPDLVRTVAVAAAGGAVAVIPTFAASAANLAFLSVKGSFTGTFAFAGSGAQPTVCSFPTQVNGNPASITPYIIGNDNARTNCNVIALATTVDGGGSTTVTGPVSCPSVFLNDLPIGSYKLEFDAPFPTNLGSNPSAISIATNSFSWTTPLTASTTTLSQSTVTESTTTDVTQTNTVTVPPADETSTTTITTATSTDTVYAPAQKKSTVFTATTTRTSTSTAQKTLPQSTVTKYSCPTTPAYCPNGAAPKDLTKCPAADNTCYTSSDNHVYQLECGTDRPGKDVTMRKCTTMEVCLATCAKTSGCNAVAYYPADRRCYLKSSSGSAVKNSQVVGARLVSKYSKKKDRRGAINLGGNPDFTYPPTPAVSTATVSPATTTTTRTLAGTTTTQTSTVTSGDPASTSIVTVDEGSISTVTRTSTRTVSAKKTVYKTITVTSNVSPKATTTVTEKRCSTRKGYGYGY